MKYPATYWLMVSVITVLYGFSFTALLRGGLWRRVPLLPAYLIVVFFRDRIYIYGLYFWPFRGASWFYLGKAVVTC